MTRATGIHDHELYRLGRRWPSRKPALKLSQILTGEVPSHPATADHFHRLVFGLYNNDRFGVCGPTSAANLVRLVTGGLLGREIRPSQEDVYDLYRRSGNPTFDPTTGAGDDGVDMQTMLEALATDGIGDGKGGKIKPIAFAKLDRLSDPLLEAAASIFGGTLWGVQLDVAQQSQSDQHPPTWDYVPTQMWGGHAVLSGKYAAWIEDVISWRKRIRTTARFRQHQLQEAWVVIWHWNLEHPAFQAGVDLPALKTAYQQLTGRPLPT